MEGYARFETLGAPTLRVKLAATWHILAELFRRHDHQQHFWLTHGGSFANPLLSLATLDPAGDTRASLLFRLGGGWGHVKLQLNTPFGPPRTTMKDLEASWTHENHVLQLLSARDPAHVVDDIEALTGLPEASQLPPTSPRVLVVRTIAGFLARRVFSREDVRVDCSWWEERGDWIKEWPAVKADLASAPTGDKRAALDASGRLWMIHNSYDDYTLQTMPSEHGVVLDMESATARHGVERTTTDLMAMYAQNGRRMEPLVSWLADQVDEAFARANPRETAHGPVRDGAS